jgi:hypothetical protein
MDTASEKHLQMMQKIVENLFRGEREVSTFYKYSDFYNDFAAPFALYVSPYSWILPFVITIIVIVTFKRAKLFGVTQKLILVAMAIDMLFTVFTGIKDGLLNFLGMNYGFIEYKICRFLLISFRVQGILHGSSLLLKSIMVVRIVLLFAFPMKIKQFQFTKWFIMLLFLHVTVCAFYFSIAPMISISPVTTVQEYKHGEPIKIIHACASVLDTDDYNVLMSYTKILFIVQIVYFMVIPIILQCVCMFVLFFLMKKQIKLVMNMGIDRRQRSVVKYLRLMKVSLLLGISFFVQEMPILITALYCFSGDLESFSKFNSLAYLLMTISFTLGKPADLLIYCSQSKAFRTTLYKRIRSIMKC